MTDNNGNGGNGNQEGVEVASPFIDLGMPYELAAHGVQSALAYEMGKTVGEDGRWSTQHMRVGIDLSKSDQMGPAQLLIDKGVFTLEEYVEYMRLAANTELANEETRLSHGLANKLSFR